MARHAGSSRRRPWLVAIALTVLIIGLVAVAISLPRVYTVVSVSDGSPQKTGTAVSTPNAGGSTMVALKNLAKPSPSDLQLPAVAPAVPTNISFTVFDTGARKRVSVSDEVVPLSVSQHSDGTWDRVLPSEASLHALTQAAWWQNGLSNEPGSPSRGTTYVYGHSCKNHEEPSWLRCAFDEVSFLHSGDKVTVTTPNGVLTYQVTQNPVQIPKTGNGQLAGSTSVYRAQVNRLVLITCGYAKDPASGTYNSPYNWVVQLMLVQAKEVGR